MLCSVAAFKMAAEEKKHFSAYQRYIVHRKIDDKRYKKEKEGERESLNAFSAWKPETFLETKCVR